MKKVYQLNLVILTMLVLLNFQTSLAQCYVSCHSSGNDTLSWVTNCLQVSFGCSPVDPTFWLAGNVSYVTVKFDNPQTDPSIRVWGMNTDDSASMSVNGVPYSLNSTSASYDAKVVCGLSPGPDGIIFANGKVTGANTPSDGNYSYQDLTINTSGIDSLTITSVSGAGWGVAGASVDCKTIGIAGVNPNQPGLFPNPTTGIIALSGVNPGTSEITVMNDLGKCLGQFISNANIVDISALPQGVYFIRVISGSLEINRRMIKF